jgi:hypothetical protein
MVRSLELFFRPVEISQQAGTFRAIGEVRFELLPLVPLDFAGMIARQRVSAGVLLVISDFDCHLF